MYLSELVRSGYYNVRWTLSGIRRNISVELRGVLHHGQYKMWTAQLAASLPENIYTPQVRGRDTTVLSAAIMHGGIKPEVLEDFLQIPEKKAYSYYEWLQHHGYVTNGHKSIRRPTNKLIRKRPESLDERTEQEWRRQYLIAAGLRMHGALKLRGIYSDGSELTVVVLKRRG
jgi:hypothetical protein